MKQRPGDQPLPRPNPDAPDMQTLVIADVEARRAIGIERYGQGLKPFDGRDNLRDLYEELIDAVIYCRKQIYERDGGPAATPRDRADVLPDEVKALARAGRKLDAVKLLRSSGLVGLIEARRLVEHFFEMEQLAAAARALAAPQLDRGLDLVAHLHRQRAFSERTFGPGPRTAGVLAHIRSELEEIALEPSDLSEWIDVVLLALDGAWRHGHTPEAIAEALTAKQAKNEARTWPDWRTVAADEPIQHDPRGDTAATVMP